MLNLAVFSVLPSFLHVWIDEAFFLCVGQMFGMSKIVAERSAAAAAKEAEVESALPLQTSVSQ
jgi:hypothetical protein